MRTVAAVSWVVIGVAFGGVGIWHLIGGIARDVLSPLVAPLAAFDLAVGAAGVAGGVMLLKGGSRAARWLKVLAWCALVFLVGYAGYLIVGLRELAAQYGEAAAWVSVLILPVIALYAPLVLGLAVGIAFLTVPGRPPSAPD